MALVVIVNEERVKVPICWEEVSTAMYQRLIQSDNTPLGLFCALINKEFDSIRKTASDEVEESIYRCTNFILEDKPDFLSADIPEYIIYKHKSYKIPKKLEALTLEQNMHVKNRMHSDIVMESLIAFTIAIYLQPILDGAEFNYDRALELEKEIEQMPIDQTYSIGFFYLSKLQNFGRGGLLYYSLRKRISKILSRRSLRLPMLTSWSPLGISAGLISMLRLTDSCPLQFINYNLMMYCL